LPRKAGAPGRGGSCPWLKPPPIWIPIQGPEGSCSLRYTDGLLEARKASGEIFSFERLDALLADSPDAAKAAEAAVNFGQDDDITVLTLTRLAVGEESSTRLATPMLTPSPA